MTELFKIEKMDWLRGLVCAVSGGVLDLLIEMLSHGMAINWKNIVISGLIAGLIFLKSKFFSNSEGKFVGKI